MTPNAYEAMRQVGRHMAEYGLTWPEWDGGEQVAAMFCRGQPNAGDNMAFLLWTCEQARLKAEDDLMLAEHQIHRAVRPLFEAHCSKAQIETEARRANDSRLPWDQIVIILIDEAARMKRQRRHHAA